jgi:mRNA interferase HigB
MTHRRRWCGRQPERPSDWTPPPGLSADQVGNCVVFDAGNNRYRIIARIKYKQGKLFVLDVMDHAEYDKQKWVDDCGCRRPAPKRQSTHKKTR